jgi:pimeloyl-ACP methyl ester carboxylesterase
MSDARGHGNSGAPDHGYYYDNLTADVICLIDTLGAEADHGVPYDQPERFSAVVQTFLRSVHLA